MNRDIFLRWGLPVIVAIVATVLGMWFTGSTDEPAPVLAPAVAEAWHAYGPYEGQPLAPIVNANFTTAAFKSQVCAPPWAPGVWDGEGWIFAANEVSNGVSVIDARTLEPVRFIQMEGTPHHVHLSPDGKWVFAGPRYGWYAAAIDTDNLEVKFIDFGQDDPAHPLHWGFDMEGRYAFVTLNRTGELAVIDAATADLITRIPIGRKPRDIAVTPDNKKVFVSHQAEGYVSVVDLGTWEARRLHRTDTDYGSGAGSGMDMSPDGKLLVVSNTADDQLAFFDVETERLVAKVDNVPGPVNVHFLGEDGALIGTGNRSDGSVTFVDRETFTIVKTLKTGAGANIPALGPDGNIWVTHNGERYLSVIDPETLEVTHEIMVQQNPHWILFSPDGRYGFATNWGGNSISVIDVVAKQQVSRVRTGLNPNGVALKVDVPRETLARWRAHSEEVRQMILDASTLVMNEPRDAREHVFLNTCLTCHDVGRIVRNNHAGDAWIAIVERMKGNGAQMTEEEQQMIVEYLQADMHKSLEIRTKLEQMQLESGFPEGAHNPSTSGGSGV